MKGLTYTAQASCGKRGFAEPIVQWIEDCSDPREALTGWLAEVAALSVDVLLVLDDADLLPTSSRTEVLSYLLGNAPANLHVALAARPTGALMACGALSTAKIARVTASDLRFRLDETLAVLSANLGAQCNPEAGIALHELTEGWPFGVQLAVAALHRSGDLEGLLRAATADIRRYFIDSVIDAQSADTVHLLVRLGLFDVIHPELCSAVLGREAPAQELLRLQDETPLLLRAEGSDWMRLHPLAREVLHERLMQLPREERRSLSRKASSWYATQGLYEEAAQQAFLADDIESAIALVEHNTYQMTTQGKSAAVLAWYQRLSPRDLEQHPGFWAPAAWALSMSDRHAEAQTLVDRILDTPNLPPEGRFEAALIEITAAAFSDRLDRASERLAEWPDPPAEARPADVPIFYIGRAFLALYSGQTDQARLELTNITNLDETVAYSPVSYGLADYAIGLSYLWEGRYALAEQVLRPALARTEQQLDRRNPVACMLAVALASACWGSGRNEGLRALLAGRLTALERHGLPDALMLAYSTQASIADHEGRQDQALHLLESLNAIGQRRGVPRLQIKALFELVRLHARHRRSETSRNLSTKLNSLLRDCRTHLPPAYVAWAEMHAELANVHAFLAQEGPPLSPDTLTAVEHAEALAQKLKRGGEEVEARLLRAEILRRKGSEDARPVLSEAISLAQAAGMLRLLRDSRPEREPAAPSTEERPEENLLQSSLDQTIRGQTLLTQKERQVLSLLSRNLSNKEIARAMDVGEQTVKWHLKNLFGKLNAAGRKHAVARARQLGLFPR